MQLIVNLYSNVKEREIKMLKKKAKKKSYQPNLNLGIYKKDFSVTFRQKAGS